MKHRLLIIFSVLKELDPVTFCYVLSYITIGVMIIIHAISPGVGIACAIILLNLRFISTYIRKQNYELSELNDKFAINQRKLSKSIKDHNDYVSSIVSEQKDFFNSILKTKKDNN